MPCGASFLRGKPRRSSLSGLEPIRFSEATAPAILRQKFLQYPHIATHFFLVYPKHLFTENCAHPSPKEFLKDFGDARRRKVRTFQGERRKKTRKFIGEGLVGSSPLRLRKRATDTVMTPSRKFSPKMFHFLAIFRRVRFLEIRFDALLHQSFQVRVRKVYDRF